MFKHLLQNIFGSQNERILKKLKSVVDKVNAFEPAIVPLSDADLKAKSDDFKSRLASGTTLDEILPEAYAVVRETAKRTLNMRHFDVQILGGIILHQGKIAEMRTGEGKTLAATLPVYLNSLTGKGVHIVTVNDYLATRDCEWMMPVYAFLGLTVGYITHDMKPQERQKAYACDVTYVTNNEIGFDYLRDNMVVNAKERVLRELHFAIVDEVDSILVDEARTPLIISGPAEESTDKYYIINRIVPLLKGRRVTEQEEIKAKYDNVNLTIGYDYIIDEKAQSTTLTEQGVAKCEKLLNVKNLYDDIQSEWVHHINQSLRAHNLFRRDVDYVIKDGQVVIVDEFTGRLMPGRRWSEGLHQSVEAKENLRIAEENQTLATVTFQNFFKLYSKLAGMTGTALTEAAEFWEIYKLDVVEIPTNKPMIRIDHADVIYRTEREKYKAICDDIDENWKKGIPMLVGTRSIETNEKMSLMLKQRGIPHQVLNAKYHETEAQIISQAGRKGAITIATNMAGRGTDIVMGGNPPNAQEAEEILKLGGFHVIGTERHEARRIDNQLRGRTGRQGDPGSSRFYLALDDELMRLFGSERISGLMQKLGMKEGEDIQHPWISKAIESAQRRVEGMNFDIRKQLIEYDLVMSKQREAIYDLRNDILEGKDVVQQIKDMIGESIDEKIDIWAPLKVYPEKWDMSAINAWLKRNFNCSVSIPQEKLVRTTREELRDEIAGLVDQAYTSREQDLGSETLRYLERMIMLQMIDNCWKDHLYDLDQLKKGVGWRAYGQKDPLVEFKHESFKLFSQMMSRVREQTVEYIFRVQIAPQMVRRRPIAQQAHHPASPGGPAGNTLPDESKTVFPHQKQDSAVLTQTAVPKKIGRNDPCPCGSGKKYKKCCGK
ncbi:MAG: preprotein translocase subunit SecA [bacterium]